MDGRRPRLDLFAFALGALALLTVAFFSARNGAALIMCSHLLAGLVCGRLVGLSNRALVPVALGFIVLLYLVWVNPPFDSEDHRNSALVHGLGGVLIGWAAAEYLRGRVAWPLWAIGAVGVVLGLTVVWEIGEYLGDRILDTALIPSKRDSAIDISFGTLGGACGVAARVPRRPHGSGDRLSGMTALEGRVIAIAGAAGGLGPVVARAPRRRRREPGAHRSRPGPPRRGRRRPRPRRRPDRRPGRRPARRGRAPTTGRRRSASASAASTASCTWSGAGREASRWRRFPLADYEFLHDLLVRTVIHTTRAFHDAARGFRARALRPRLLVAGAEPRRHQRRLRRDQGGGRGVDPGARRHLPRGRARRRPPTSS